MSACGWLLTARFVVSRGPCPPSPAGVTGSADGGAAMGATFWRLAAQPGSLSIASSALGRARHPSGMTTPPPGGRHLCCGL